MAREIAGGDGYYVSNRLARSGGRRIPEAVLERDYCIAWFLAGLSGARIENHLMFKGGTAIKRCYFGEYRFSEDLDFTLKSEMDFATILSGLDEVFDANPRTGAVIETAEPGRSCEVPQNRDTQSREWKEVNRGRSGKNLSTNTDKRKSLCGPA